LKPNFSKKPVFSAFLTNCLSCFCPLCDVHAADGVPAFIVDPTLLFLLRLASLPFLSTLLLLIFQPSTVTQVPPPVGVPAFAVLPAVADVPAAVGEPAFAVDLTVAHVPAAVGLPASTLLC